MSYGRDMAVRDPFGNPIRIGRIVADAWKDGADTRP